MRSVYVGLFALTTLIIGSAQVPIMNQSKRILQSGPPTTSAQVQASLTSTANSVALISIFVAAVSNAQQQVLNANYSSQIFSSATTLQQQNLIISSLTSQVSANATALVTAYFNLQIAQAAQSQAAIMGAVYFDLFNIASEVNQAYASQTLTIVAAQALQVQNAYITQSARQAAASNNASITVNAATIAAKANPGNQSFAASSTIANAALTFAAAQNALFTPASLAIVSASYPAIILASGASSTAAQQAAGIQAALLVQNALAVFSAATDLYSLKTFTNLNLAFAAVNSITASLAVAQSALSSMLQTQANSGYTPIYQEQQTIASLTLVSVTSQAIIAQGAAAASAANDTQMLAQLKLSRTSAQCSKSSLKVTILSEAQVKTCRSLLKTATAKAQQVQQVQCTAATLQVRLASAASVQQCSN